MTAAGLLQIAVFFLLILALTKPTGLYMAKVFEGEITLLRPVERLIYRLSGIDPSQEQHWTQYAASLLAFSLVSFLFAYVIQRLQGYLPLNPQHFGASAVTPDLAFNTAVSFLTNTNWQAYSGETTLSYFVQMAALTVQNFVSAAAGVACAVATVRGFSRQQSPVIGNFWVDLTRSTLYIFLPLSFVFALFLCSQGVIQNFDPYKTVKTLEGATQTLPMGPVASQEAIKMVGTNGGGFFNANSAHPFENPTPLTNFVQLIAIFLIPAGLTYTFGRMVQDTRQGWAIFAAFSIMFLAGVFIAYSAEQAGNPILTNLGIDGAAGNMEGKETRFGVAASTLFAVVTTGASCGAVNAMHESLTPLAALVPIFNMETGEVIFGGVGAGLYGVLLYAILAVFIAGLMVGRTPEYIGKKIEQKEVKMAMLALIATAASILIFASLSLLIHPQAGLNTSGPRGFAEILYAYTSATANNGSAFAGLNANTPWYNLTIGISALIGRFFFLLPLLAAAGSLAAKKRIPTTSGTFPTHGPLFIGLLVGTIIIVGALTYFPALSLGPVVEHFLMQAGQLF